jgi:glyoxylase-like metal-dependent hydrolase (beta-lactamase superfamily II)
MPAPNDPSSVTFNPIPPPSPTAQPWSISIIPLGSLRGWGGLFVEGYEGDVQVDDFAFLLEREGKRVLWDLGLRKVSLLAPSFKEEGREKEGLRHVADPRSSSYVLLVGQDLAFPDKDLRQSALNFNGQSSLSALDALRSQSPPIEPESIDSVAFSHTHFDHVGDVGEFPKNVGVIVGPRDKEGEVGRKELAKELQVNEGVLEGREIR